MNEREGEETEGESMKSISLFGHEWAEELEEKREKETGRQVKGTFLYKTCFFLSSFAAEKNSIEYQS